MRWIVRIGGIAAAAVLVLAGLLVAVPTERIAGLVTERLAAATGREVVIGGEVRPSLWPSLGIRAADVRVGNPDWVTEGPFLAADSLHVSVAWGPLLRGEVVVEEIELQGPEVVLVRAADGRTSWDVAAAGARSGAPGAAPPQTPSATAVPLALDAARIVNGQLRWIDAASGRDIKVSDLQADLVLPAGADPARLAGSARIDGSPVEVELSLDEPRAVLTGGARPAALSLGWDGGRATFDGRLSAAPALDGDVEIDARDIGPLLGLAGVARPQLPAGLGRDRIAAAGRVTLTESGSLHLRDVVLTLDENRLSTELDLLPGEERPQLRGTLTADSLSLASAPETPASSDGVGGGDPAEAAGWPDDPIDVSGLFAVDAELAVRMASLDLGTAEVGPVEINAALTRGRLVLDIGQVGIYGGRLAGQFVVNGRGGLSVGGDLILAGVQLRPMLARFADFDRLEGSGNASLQFLGVGNDVATIMASLEGEGDLAFGAGAIVGLDIAGMVRNLDASFRGEGERTVYDSISANFTIDGGVLSNDDLFLDAPWGTVRGEGVVDLGDRSLDYRLSPGVLRDAEGRSGIEVPVLVSGPWSRLRFRPDLEYLAEQEFIEQRDRLAAEAEERIGSEIRDRVGGLLGAGEGTGDSPETVEDALQDRLAREVDGVLSDLLGGGQD